MTTLHSNNIKDIMDAIGKVMNSDDRTRSSRQQMCRHLGWIYQTSSRPPNVSSSSLQRARWTRANCEMRVVVSPKITRAGVDNSATWFVDGMIHRQRRK